MLEAHLATSKKKGQTGYLVYLDFTDEVVGTKTLTDQSPSPIALPLVGSANPANFGVVIHPTIGKCFQFNGTHYFYATDNPLKDFSLDSYDIEVAFIRDNTNAQYIFATGGWGTTYRTKGTTVSTDATSTPFQTFQINAAGTYQRNIHPNPMPVGQLVDLLIQKRPTVTTITNRVTGTVATYAAFNTNGDSFLGIGGAESDGSLSFKGYLKYLKIKRVVT